MSESKINICDVCGRQYVHRSSLSRHKTTHDGKIYECQYCAKQYNSHSNLLRHEKICHMKEEQNTPTLVEENKQLKKIVLKLSANKDEQVKQLTEKIEQLVTTVQELKNKPTGIINSGNNNTITNVNIHVHLNEHDVDLYEIKKRIVGEQGAYNYIMGLLNSTPSNKLNWLLDKTIFERPENVPIRVINTKEPKLIIHDKKDSQIQDDGVRLDKICTRIIGRSVTHAINHQMSDIIQRNDDDIIRRDKQESNEQEQHQIDDRIDERISVLYSGSMKENMSDKLIKLDRPVTHKHLKGVLEQLSSATMPM